MFHLPRVSQIFSKGNSDYMCAWEREKDDYIFVHFKQGLTEFISQNKHSQVLKCFYTFSSFLNPLFQVFIEKAVIQF